MIMVKLPLFLALLALLVSDVFAKKNIYFENPDNCLEYEKNKNGFTKKGLVVPVSEWAPLFNSCKLPPKGQTGKLKPRDKKGKK